MNEEDTKGIIDNVRWDKGEAPIETFTIITGEPNSLAAELHDRMPVILDPPDYDAWLTARDTSIPQALLQPRLS